MYSFKQKDPLPILNTGEDLVSKLKEQLTYKLEEYDKEHSILPKLACNNNGSEN